MLKHPINQKKKNPPLGKNECGKCFELHHSGGRWIVGKMFIHNIYLDNELGLMWQVK